MQRTCSLEARIKVGIRQGAGVLGVGGRAGQAPLSPFLPQSVVQSYLEGVKTGVWQLAQALETAQGAREALGQAHGLLRDMAEAIQTLEPLREQVVQHKQLQALSQLLPRLRAGEYTGALGFSLPTVSQKTLKGLGYYMERHTRDFPESNSGFRWNIKQGAN